MIPAWAAIQSTRFCESSAILSPLSRPASRSACAIAPARSSMRVEEVYDHDGAPRRSANARSRGTESASVMNSGSVFIGPLLS